MFRMHLLYLILIQSITFTIAQAPDTLWTKAYGGDLQEIGNSVKETYDGGFIITGSSQSFSLAEDIYIIKTNSIGDTVWTKAYFSESYNSDRGYCIIQTVDSGYIITGSSNAFRQIGQPSDLLLMKINNLGDTLWCNAYGGDSWEDGYSVAQTSDNGFIMIGQTQSYGFANADFLTIKTNSLGDTLWYKVIGGNSSDYGQSIQQTTDGGYIAVGWTSSFGTGSADVWLIKMDQAGETLWTKTFGDNAWDGGFSVEETIDGGYIVVGEIGIRGGDLWIIRTNSSGEILWTKILGGDNHDAGRDIHPTSDGGYIITGFTSSFGAGENDVWIIKINSVGDTIWTKTIGGIKNDEGHSIDQTIDGGYIIVGYTFSFGGGPYGSADLWLIKLEPEVVEVKEINDLIIEKYSLYQNYPNPFNPRTKISWQSPVSGWQSLKIYDVLCNEIATLVDEYKPAGKYEVEFEASSLTSGVYFYQMRAENYIETKKMILLK